MKRKANITRKTKETSIKVDLNIDGKGKYKIDTGIGFLNHMLEQLSKHSSIDLNVKAKGDTHIDLHHTTEDTGIAIGECIKKASKNFDQLEMETLAKKMSKGNFDLDDFAKQLKQMGNMGGVSGILSMLPGVSKAQKLMAENKISDKLINHQIAIINSMTKQERSDPNLIKASRKIRISKGSGTKVQDVNKLLKQFLQSQKMMKRMKSMGKGGIPSDLMQKLQGNFPPKLN